MHAVTFRVTGPCSELDSSDSYGGNTMKKGFLRGMTALLLVSISGTIAAQDSGYHPNLSSNFIFTAGAFWSDDVVKLRAEGVDIDADDVDFGKSVGVDKSNTIANFELRWKFGGSRKWSIAGQYFSNNAKGDATLKEDVEWQGLIFREGTFVEAGVKLEVIRAFLGYSFVKQEQHDFGVGAGVHNLDLSSFIGGEVLIGDDTTEYQRADASGSQILPNIGSWYAYSPASKWLIRGRVDWISANIGNYDGTLWNANVGVDFQPWRHVGFGLSYQYFNLNLKVDKSDWRGGVDLTYSGPMLSMTVNW
jgi:hypothetical protein